MKNIILFLVAVAFVNISFAQLTFSSKKVSLQMEPGEDNKATIEIFNNSNYDIDLEWELVSNDLNENWSIQFCECNTCYTNDFAPIDQVTQGGMSCPTMSSGGPNAAWYLIVDPGSEPQTYAEWKIVVENITDRIYDTLTFAAEPTNSVVENTNSSSFSIYPNPAKEQLNVVFDNASAKDEMHFNMYSIVGNSVKGGVINDVKTVIETGELQSGVYILQVNSKSGESVLHKKIVVE